MKALHKRPGVHTFSDNSQSEVMSITIHRAQGKIRKSNNDFVEVMLKGKNEMKENGMFSFAGDKIHESSRILRTRLKWDNEEGSCLTNESKGEIGMDQKIHERDR